MVKSIIKYFVSILVITLLVSSSVTMVIVSSNNLEENKKQMLASLKLTNYSFDYSKDLTKQIDKINDAAYEDNTRLTIIDLEGNVIADSAREEIDENHRHREEVKEALNHKVGYATRYSETVKKNLLYVAYNNGKYILRLAVPYNGIFDNMASLIEPLAISSLLALTLAIALSYKFSYSLTKPINDINDQIALMQDDKDIYFENYKYDEFNSIAYKLKEQHTTIQEAMNEIKAEREKINSIINQMNEGFILLDNDYDVLMYNIVVKDMYPLIDEKHSIKESIFDYKLINALDSFNDQQVSVDIKKDKLVYRCFISRVEYGVTILMVDVTSEVNANKMRSQFFSNVSHELKTPLTSIKGYSELLQQGMIEDKESALKKIQKETDKMNNLIGDILMISRLENNDVEVIKTQIHFDALVNEIMDTLQISADNKGIKITKDIDDYPYLANYQHMQQLLTNLINNAIKYNKENGYVDIKIKHQDNNYTITISDNGKGISTIDQTRVFERFYRCDKGRDKETGGTGLGLAIVKHIVQYYNGTITLNSTLDKGSTFIIDLPIE